MLSWARGMQIVFPNVVIVLSCMRAVEHRVHWTGLQSAAKLIIFMLMVSAPSVVLLNRPASNANR